MLQDTSCPSMRDLTNPSILLDAQIRESRLNWQNQNGVDDVFKGIERMGHVILRKMGMNLDCIGST